MPRFTSVLCEYFDLFWHRILFWKMATTTGQRSQVDNQFWGCSLSKLTGPQEYQFRPAACKHCLQTSSSVLFIVFIKKKKKNNQPTLSYHLQAQQWFTLLWWVWWNPPGSLTQRLSEHCLNAGCLYYKAQSTTGVVSISGNLTQGTAVRASSYFYWSWEKDLPSSASLHLPWGQLREER